MASDSDIQSPAFVVIQTITLGALNIGVSGTLIGFNKYLMHPGRFSHAAALSSIHMIVITTMSLLLYTAAPKLYPSMPKARENWQTLLKFIAPLGVLFSIALVCSNLAYRYSSVAFLQFLKQGNVAIVFFMSCIVGLQVFSFRKVAILGVVVAGCSLCTKGEIHFVLFGLVLQLVSQFMECTKNLIGEIVLGGSMGLKLDVLTFVFFQAPMCLIPLLVSVALNWTPEIVTDFVAIWPLLLANALVAFVLNVVIALTLKRLSALAFVIIGLLKDGIIVASSAVVFGDPISLQQRLGFGVTVMGMSLWSHMKIQEQQAAKKKAGEKTPLLPSHDKKEVTQEDKK
eukprot:CAMPEP_0197630754 /NCGR_PEP_ID=MMETSP1338-20131121/8134_1 /TAXON_ID=43686 ORGANISM="Pelagodinium beii, Strain RCC1491" /NCGR_SAMPLE_ID=MMETSP1338 /ASSEMBLY_ACC=CAM_ASM_000754 /LENGTH=341 /DNA_ID=CAMNT_0043202049 /DNA_START=79 /DNA_END=1104 /DNA_ORIENTATION=+